MRGRKYETRHMMNGEVAAPPDAAKLMCLPQ
jgi:hypothetical protein